jgi:hypothetical protein
MQKIGAEELQERLASGEDLLLVCAYRDEQKCRKINIEGSIPYSELESRLPRMPKDREIILY